MNDSSIGGISVRAILAAMIVLSFCGLSIWMQKIDMLQDIALVAVSFYFGQKSNGGSNEKVNTVAAAPAADTVKS